MGLRISFASNKLWLWVGLNLPVRNSIRHWIWPGEGSTVQWKWSPPAPGSLKALMFPPLLNNAHNKGTQGVRARYGAELPPFISIVRYLGRPVILGMDQFETFQEIGDFDFSLGSERSQKRLFLQLFGPYWGAVKPKLAEKITTWGSRLALDGPTRKPRHASVLSTHSDTQAVPAFHCIRMFKGIFSTR